MNDSAQEPIRNGIEIAIIGMSCRFPGGDTINEFWENLKNGVESVTFFTDKELQTGGIDLETIQSSNYIKAGGAITGTEWFDNKLFNYSPRELEVMDPQLKILHECAWEALESSAYFPDTCNGLIGTYIGAATNLYWLETVYHGAKDFIKEAEFLNGSQFFGTRLSHKLNLRGPSYTVQTACSSSLVAVHLACQALLSGDCDIALAGGVSLTLPEKRGYLYKEGMILSPDGHCRPFDANARGTVNGNGAGIVVLKRMEDAIADGDFIHAVVKGSAINNDGADKVSFNAPSVEGQAAVIRAAHHMAEVESESISYVEAHGTGTMLGDPIEVEALKLAFNTEKNNFCGIGSVKGNIGHLDNAAGIAGLIKTVVALEHRMIPPSINYEKANEKINFGNSPFYVQDTLAGWKNREFPLRAGVSSFGMGGTNAHVVLEEPPQREASERSRRYQLLSFSAQTKKSLEEQTKRLAEYLTHNNNVNLADVAYTLLNGRKNLKYRRALVVSDIEEAKQEFFNQNSAKVQTNLCDGGSKQIIFMFPGQGAQYVNMGLDLYKEEKRFRDEVNLCCEILEEISGVDWKEVLYPKDLDVRMRDDINQTSNTQPAIFIFEYSLAKTLMEWGIYPDGMIGHSIGEYVAACLAGVFSLKQALQLVYERATLMQQLPKGSMISVMASENEILPLMNQDVSIAAVNSPISCVISGSDEAIYTFEGELIRDGFQFKKLATSHAFHSSMMDSILDTYGKKLKEINFHDIKIPFISNLTGEWITEEQAKSADYWVNHLRHVVKFSEGVKHLLSGTENVFVEVGPGRTLSSFVRQHTQGKSICPIVNTVRHPKEKTCDDKYLLQSIGKLHIHGVKIEWSKYFSQERRYRVPLPTYPFERQFFSLSKDIEIEESSPLSQSDYVEELKRNIVPKDDKQRKIIESYKRVTGVKQVSIHDDFFELGGSSLTAINVVSSLQKDFDISINHLFEYPRVSDLAQHMTYKKEKTIPDALATYLIARGERHRLMEEKVRGDIAIRSLYDDRNKKYYEINLSCQVSYKEVLLTGSTGYLGVYLLHDLLTELDCNVHLIVRSDNCIQAENRIKEKVCSYFGTSFYDKYKKRIFVYSGDLTKKYMGLDLPNYQYLSETIQCIIHSAGSVSHYGKYEKSYEANVLATRNVIDFSLKGVKKDVNHISTLAVASGVVKNNEDILYTEYDNDLGQIIENPYPKTKLEAEKIVLEMRGKGINVNIFRVGNIGFDSKTGRFQENIEQNALYSMMKSYIRIGLVPEMERDIDFACVDDVSQAIIKLFNKKELMNETHHIFNPNYVSLSALLTTYGLDIDVKETSIDKFIDYIFDEKQFNQYASDIYNLQLHCIGDELKTFNDVEQTLFHIMGDKTNMLLRKTGFVWNNITDEMTKKMIRYGQKVNYFEKH